MSDLIEKIKWCRNNDDKCKVISKKARIFYDTYLTKKGILDYMQKTLTDVKNRVGNYTYNTITPLNSQISLECWNVINYKYPPTKKGIKDIELIPSGRAYGILQGIEHLVNFVLKKSSFCNVAKYEEELFKNKLSTVSRYTLAGKSMSVKVTSDTYKGKEQIHESYVGIFGTNKLTKLIPNFSYIYGHHYTEKDNNPVHTVISEYIEGETLKSYIDSNKFVFKEFIEITLQLCLALYIAQKQCGFVHWDLTPWNIMLKRTTEYNTISYDLDAKTMSKLKQRSFL